ncbi:MAG TPA: hypothetical protein VLJ86_23335 [Ramlibacter sp.]|nr:hypothetical protein [Ramlibacter sp.]
MKQLPRAIAELDGGLFLPRQLVDLVEALLVEHEQLVMEREDSQSLAVLEQTRQLLRFTGARPPLPASREQLGLDDPQKEIVARNLLRERSS